MLVRRLKNVPVLNLTLDAQSGTAGVETRIESFIDIIRYQKAGGYGNQIDDRKKIAFPRFNHYNYAVKYIVEQGLDAKYVLLPPATKETAELGSKYSPDYACAPFKHTLGSLIEAVEAGADVVVETGGLCRLDYYGVLQEESFGNWGTSVNLSIWPDIWGAKKGDWLKLARHLSPKLKVSKLTSGVYDGVKMAEYMDEIEALYYQNAGFEAVKGSFKKVYRQFYLQMQTAENRQEIREAYQKAKQKMSELELKIPEHPVRIGIVGEYFTAMDPGSNQFLQDKLVRLGGVCIPIPECD